MSEPTAEVLFKNYHLAQRMAEAGDRPAGAKRLARESATASQHVRLLEAVLNARASQEMSRLKPDWDITDPGEAIVLTWFLWGTRVVAVDSLKKYFEPGSLKRLDETSRFDWVSRERMSKLLDYADESGFSLGRVRDQIALFRPPIKRAAIPAKLRAPLPQEENDPFFAHFRRQWKSSGELRLLLLSLDDVRTTREVPGELFYFGTLVMMKINMAIDVIEKDAESLESYLEELFERDIGSILG